MKKFYKGNSDWQDDLNKNFADLYQNVKTYNELQTMIEGKLLVAGTQYLLSDYRTKYQQPDTLAIKEMAIERLVLTAIDVDKFGTICSSLDYPQDVIYYKFDLNICEDGLTSRKGFILRRKDESPNVSIDAPLDWRTIVWARWKVNPTQYLVGSTLTNYAVWTAGAPDPNLIYIVGTSLYQPYNIAVPTSNTDSNTFFKVWDFNNVIKEDITIGRKLDCTALKLVKTGLPIDTLTFGANCNRISIDAHNIGVYNSKPCLDNNTFGDNCRCISSGAGFHDNVLGTCASISFGASCYNNVFGTDCSNNTFSANCYNNIFANGCAGNLMGSNSSGNVLGANCSNNTFGSACYGNTFGANCYSNALNAACYNNTLGCSCNVNTFCTNCCNNIFGNYKACLYVKYLRYKNLSAITALENKDYTNTVEKRSDGATVSWSLNTSNVPIYAVIA